MEIKQQIKEMSFCVIDLETTGGNQDKDKIIEVGLVKIEKLKIKGHKNYLIRPNIAVPDFIQKLTSITPHKLQDAPQIEDIIDEIINFIGDSILVAHNTSFDIPFLNSELLRMGRPVLKNQSLCTNLMTKYLIPNLLNSNLNYMCKIFGINHSKAHRALDDAMATAELLISYLNIFIAKDVAKINHLYYPRNRYELDRINIKNSPNKRHSSVFSKIKTPFLIVIKGVNGVILFAFPCTNNEKEITWIKKKMKELPWESLTIRLFGSLTEATIHFANLFLKINQEQRNEVLDQLWSLNIKKQKRVIHQNLLTVEQESISSKKNHDDFVVFPHLVPEQLVVIPLFSISTKTMLVFRYPGHKKKLLQFISAKISRIGKKQKNYIPNQIMDFLLTYFYEHKDSNQLFFCSKSMPMKRPEEFYKNVDEFLSKNHNSYQYPQKYV